MSRAPALSPHQRRLTRQIGLAVRAARREKGLTASEMARRLHVTPARIWQLEHAYRGCFPSIATLDRIASLCGCSVWVLLMRAETNQL